MPWMDANGISIHYELSGEGPAVLCARDGRRARSWDESAPALERKIPRAALRPARLRPEQKVRRRSRPKRCRRGPRGGAARQPLPPPYHFVTVAAATMQALIYLIRAPGPHRELYVLQSVHRATRGGGAQGTAGLAERAKACAGACDHARNSWPLNIGDRAAYAAYRGRYLAHDPVCFAALTRAARLPQGRAEADHGGRRASIRSGRRRPARAVRADHFPTSSCNRAARITWAGAGLLALLSNFQGQLGPAVGDTQRVTNTMKIKANGISFNTQLDRCGRRAMDRIHQLARTSCTCDRPRVSVLRYDQRGHGGGGGDRRPIHVRPLDRRRGRADGRARNRKAHFAPLEGGATALGFAQQCTRRLDRVGVVCDSAVPVDAGRARQQWKERIVSARSRAWGHWSSPRFPLVPARRDHQGQPALSKVRHMIRAAR